MASKSLSIVLPGYTKTLSGGYMIAYGYANYAARHNYDVTVYYYSEITSKTLPRYIASFVLNTLHAKQPVDWFAFDKKIKTKYIASINDKTVSDASFIVATGAQTAKPISELPDSKGEKFYLIQGYETWVYPAEQVEETYRYGMRNITVSKWLKKLVESKSSTQACYIPNPINPIFRKDSKISKIPCSLSVLYHEEKPKGFEYAWEAILRIKQELPELTVQMFGAYTRPEWIPEWVTFSENATPEQLRDIYNKTEVYLCASLNDGFGLTCVEAMACGCALVASEFLGVSEYAENGKNALLSPTKDSFALANNAIKILSNSKLRETIASNGIATGEGYTWNQAGEKFIEALESSYLQKEPSLLAPRPNSSTPPRTYRLAISLPCHPLWSCPSAAF